MNNSTSLNTTKVKSVKLILVKDTYLPTVA